MRPPQFPYGGQAVIEGVMMRGLQQATVAVRAPDGQIVYRDRPLNVARRMAWARLPLLRGIQMLGGLITTSLLMSIGLFFVLPLVLATLIARVGLGILGRELLEGALRLLIFVGYLLLMRRSRDIRRVFAYHGAEHKAVNAYEAGAALTPAHVRGFTLIHPRCGTSFVLVVLLLSIILFSFLSGLPFLLRLLS